MSNFFYTKGFQVSNMHIIWKVFVCTFQILAKGADILKHFSTRVQCLEPMPKKWAIIFDQKTYLVKWFWIFWKMISFERRMNEVVAIEIWFGLFSCNSHNFILKFQKQNENAQNLAGVPGTTLFGWDFLPWGNVATMTIYTWLDSQNAVLS